MAAPWKGQGKRVFQPRTLAQSVGTEADRSEVIVARGVGAVQATHPSTLEVTTDRYLTSTGDCIVAIAADRSPATFDPAFAEACQRSDATIEATLEVNGYRSVVRGRGDPALTFADPQSAVMRTSTYVDDRTVMVGADAAAADLDRSLVDALRSGGTLTVTLSVST